MPDKKIPCEPKPNVPCEAEGKTVCKSDKKKPKKEQQKAVEECVEPEPPPMKDVVLMSPSSNDPIDIERKKCLEDCHVKPVYKILKECTKRVSRKILYTSENCHEETVDLMEALDKCVKSKAFNRLA